MKKIFLCDSISQNRNNYEVRLIIPNDPGKKLQPGQSIPVKAAVSIALPNLDKDSQIFEVGKEYTFDISEITT